MVYYQVFDVKDYFLVPTVGKCCVNTANVGKNIVDVPDQVGFIPNRVHPLHQPLFELIKHVLDGAYMGNLKLSSFARLCVRVCVGCVNKIR
jgi:hypothetical protein